MNVVDWFSTYIEKFKFLIKERRKIFEFIRNQLFEIN
jgi:hypothetical protein